ncbi:MAG: hypothetical protein QOI56_2072 [Actinomycetota bacterium]|nr:hypothetical protein [Actinomycetota bacterium]
MRKVVNRRIRRQGKGGTVAADVTAVVSANTGADARVTAASSTSKVRIVQRKGRTEIDEG